MSAKLEASNITLWRGDTLLLDAVNLSADAGQVTQIAGANGSGKTSLLRILCGASLPDEGEVSWAGIPLSKQRDVFNSTLIHIGHRAGVHAQLTAQENLELSCQLNEGAADKIGAVLDDLNVGHIASIPAGHLSAGQQRRVALAKLALMPTASCWILDEPLTALDQVGRDWVATQLRAQCDRGGVVVLTSHQPIAEETLGTTYSLDNDQDV